MKINEKHLVLFANGTAAVDKQGFLNKRGELNKSFQRRWFVLKGNLLFYFDKRGDQEPIGVIVLEGCSVELVENTDKFSFELSFLGSGARTYVLAADSQEEMEVWMQVLACASYDYMKCAVEELQRQMDELNAASQRKHHRSKTAPQNAITDGQATYTRRANPFNTRDGSADLEQPLVIFAAPTPPTDNKHLRTFKEMHDRFGAYISLKTAENKKSNDLS